MKTILITGVNRGIGNALSKIFLENNWKVIGTVRDISKKIDLEKFENYQKEQLDVSSFESMDSLAKRISNQGIDVLLNNAGIMDAKSMANSIYKNEHKLSNVYLINSISPYILSEKLLPNIELGSEKLVVSVSSLVSKMTNILPSHWVYGSSKSGLNYAMKAFAENYPNIKVSLVRPGWVKTDMGGEQAPMNVEYSAKIIFNNIINHTENLPHSAMVGPEGDITQF